VGGWSCLGDDVISSSVSMYSMMRLLEVGLGSPSSLCSPDIVAVKTLTIHLF
jgi:hypothetical protein